MFRLDQHRFSGKEKLFGKQCLSLSSGINWWKRLLSPTRETVLCTGDLAGGTENWIKSFITANFQFLERKHIKSSFLESKPRISCWKVDGSPLSRGPSHGPPALGNSSLLVPFPSQKNDESTSHAKGYHHHQQQHHMLAHRTWTSGDWPMKLRWEGNCIAAYRENVKV